MNPQAFTVSTLSAKAVSFADMSYEELNSRMSEVANQIDMLTNERNELFMVITTRKEQVIADYVCHSNQQKDAYRLMMEDERKMRVMGIDPSSVLSEHTLDSALSETPSANAEEVVEEKSDDKETCLYNSSNAATKLKPLVVWPGGKKKELKTIISNLPPYNRFFEPFVGGGAGFMGINAKKHYINDFSSSLINLYRNIASSDEQFFHNLQEIDMSIERAVKFADEHWKELADIYENFRRDVISKEEMQTAVSKWCYSHCAEILHIIGEFTSKPCTLIDELKDYLSSHWGKFTRLKNKNITDAEWIKKHISVAILGAVYRNFRNLYNNKEIEKLNLPLHAALTVYIRQFCFSGMFKYDKNGDFTNSFGGISNLNKRLTKNIKYYKSDKIKNHFKNAHIYNCDFEEFLIKTNPQENDFIFLDPPYDCPFNEYDGNEFNRDDHKRLADYLLKKCKAKWMMVINKTDFIFDLYNQAGIHIQEYDKTYTCNAKNCNDRNATHLLITNYDVNEQQSADTQSRCVPQTLELKEKKVKVAIAKKCKETKREAIEAAIVAEVCKAVKKTRNKYNWREIHQLTVDGKFIRSWNSIGEISKLLGFNHASISKCVNGHYKSAEGYKWVGVPTLSYEEPIAMAA